MYVKAELEDTQSILISKADVFASSLVKRELNELEESSVNSKSEVKLKTVKRRRKA